MRLKVACFKQHESSPPHGLAAAPQKKRAPEGAFIGYRMDFLQPDYSTCRPEWIRWEMMSSPE